MDEEERFSIVEYFKEHEGYKCGYCKSADGNYSQGMWAHELTCLDYQNLIDRGWRRSGKYCYRPSWSTMCCPSYTIKCQALNFRPTKSQKKVLKNFNKYLATGLGRGSEEKAVGEGGDAPPMADTSASSNMNAVTTTASKAPADSSETSEMATTTTTTASGTMASSMSASPSRVVKKTPVKGTGPDPSKPKPVKAKLARREKHLAKMRREGKEPDAVSAAANEASVKKNAASAKTNAFSGVGYTEDSGKSLEDLIREGESLKDAKVRFELRLVRSEPPSPEFQASFAESFQLYKKYQTVIHGDDPDEVSEKQFKRFLCDSPLIPASTDSSYSLGSFHHQYFVDGRLIAVGVLDLLPRSISSVYLYYDPAFDFLSLGTFSALREIALTRRIAGVLPSLKEYYMGFYIHSCQKMRYKGSYRPSFLLCPEKLSWVKIESCIPKLDLNKFSRFAENGNDDDEDVKNFDGDLSQVLVLYSRRPMTYETYRRFAPSANDEDEVRSYAELLGQSVKNVLLYRSRSQS